MSSSDAKAGGEDHEDHNVHHRNHSVHMKIGDSYPSTMFMGTTSFVLGGVEGASDSAMGGMGRMSTTEAEDGIVFTYDTKLMFTTSFTG